MFVFERVLNEYHDSQEEWNKACNKWISEGNEYGWRSKNDYRDKHPSPSDKVHFAIRGAIIVVLTAIFGVMIVWIATGIVHNKHDKPKETAIQGKNCQYFNKNDHVRIQYGDYRNINGTIIGGCGLGENYQVKIDKNSQADLPADGEGAIDVSDRTISVDSNENLVVIE